MSVKKRLVLTFDAFGTLFTPNGSVGAQYARVAEQHGLSGLVHGHLNANFVTAFNRAQEESPNYGKATGMEPAQWWSNIIEATFGPIIGPKALPRGVVPDLLRRFSTAEGYRRYPDVLPFFQRLRSQKTAVLHHPTTPVDTVVGIITNSDDRVGSVLQSQGLHVSPRRFLPSVGRDTLIKEPTNDVDFIALSYDVGVAKPDCGIFNAAKLCAALPDSEEDVEHIYVHVGDDPIKDCQAAEQAGWKGVCLGGHGRDQGQKSKQSNVCFLEDLNALDSYVWNDILDIDLKMHEEYRSD